MCKALRQILNQIERCPESTTSKLLRVKNRTKPDSNASKYGISVAVSVLWQFVSDVDKGLRAMESMGCEDEFPVFSMMNEMLFNQKKFREVITQIMNIYYMYMGSEASPQHDPQIVLLGQLVEALALYIKRSRHEESLSEDEAFSNTIALMKINRILQLKDFKVSELDMYCDFSIERVYTNTETNITNSLAAGDKARELQHIAAEKLATVRRLRADMSKWRNVLQIFDRCFTNLLYTKLSFAVFWKDALASENFGYAVESYAEKCSRELEQFETKPDGISRVMQKLREAEKMLLEIEEKAQKNSPRFLTDVNGLSELVNETPPLLVSMCLDVIGTRYKNLIGEVNLQKYRALRHLSIKETAVVSKKETAVKRNRSIFRPEKTENTGKPEKPGKTSLEKHALSKVSKMADMFKFGVSESSKRASVKRTRSRRCNHQDIVDEYESTFSQTLAMLERS
ncbi:hypothetical protein JCM33374_g3280 [Metschnikowia sp. JCM 33374]|nr:hypothetical protein JCM33374_g3280 [Metschnikowia sp. JCM 33374]